jgi:hypothetical protein
MTRWLVVCMIFIAAIGSTGVAEAAEIVGIVLDFPKGSLDSVTKIELYIKSQPSRYTTNPGYKSYTNYIAYITDGALTEPVMPGALGLDWTRSLWNGEKITYSGGVDTLQSGIVDGFEYNSFNYPNVPVVTDVKLVGYPGRYKFTYPVYLGRFTYLIFSYDILGIMVEPDLRLEDAVMALQTMAGITLTPTAYKWIDINSDKKIGVAEAVYILQKISGKR